jgi:hypothetical protein
MSSLAQVIESVKSEIKVNSDGKGFVSIRGLARLVDTTQSHISEYISGVHEAPKKMLERLNSVGFEGVPEDWSQTGIPDLACSAFILYYALDAREYKGRQQAKNVLSAYVAIGIRSWLQDATGYVKQSELAVTDVVTYQLAEMKLYNQSLESRLSAIELQFKNQSKRQLASKTTEKLNPVKVKIFLDLVRACKGETKKIADFRTHSLGRRKDVLGVYGDRKQTYLLKSGIVAMFSDATKHGYGTFNDYKGLFTPVSTQSDFEKP